MQRGKLSHDRPEMQRQQRQAHTHNLATPVAGELLRHIEVTHCHAVFFQHFPAQAEYQPEQRQFFTERPQQIADVELHGQQNQANGQNHKADRHRTDQIDKDRFWRVELAVITQLPHFVRQLLLIFS
ncbi:hypothetical protein D3C80_1135950 [compost metagenome]